MQRIDEVPWHRLQHAYGTCEQFPDVLRWLASADARDRSRALNWLDELLYHQGTHYPANEFAVPFLLRTAANPELPGREHLFAFLNRFLTDGRPPLSPGQRDELNRRLQKQFQYGFGEGSGHWRDYRRRSVAAAWTCRDLLASVLRHDPAPAARCWAVYLLADLAKTGRIDGGGWTEEKRAPWFMPAVASEILRLFREQATADPDLTVRVSTAFGIGFLRCEPDAAPIVVDLYSQSPDSAVRVAAAAARHVAETSVPRDVTACVVEEIVRNLLSGQRRPVVSGDNPENLLATAYANLGLGAESLDTGKMGSRSQPFGCVPFPRLPAWLNASLDEKLPLADLVEQTLEWATTVQRIRAVRFLGRVRLPQPEIGDRLKRLITHGDPNVRMAAAVALNRHHRKGPVAPIVEVFRGPLRSRRARLRRRALEGLLAMWFPGRGGPIPTSMPFVVEAAKRETDCDVQRLMCKLFARAVIEDRSENAFSTQASRILAHWVADPAIRRDAVAALSQLCWPPGERGGRRMPTEALEPLLAVLNSNAPERRSVPGILRRIKSKRVLPALLDILRQEMDPEVRQSLRWALQSLPKSVGAVDAVLAAHRDSGLLIDGPVSQFLALAAPKSEEVAKLLVQVLQAATTEAPARQNMVEALGWLQVAPEHVANALLHAALTDPVDSIRAQAAKALVCAKIPMKSMLPRAQQIAESGDDAALSGLLELLDHGNTPKMPGLARSLLPVLEHPNYWRRQKTVSALARMGARDAEGERAVLARLDDEHTTVRREAAKYPFKCLPPEEVCPPLLRALGDENAEIWAWWNLKGRASSAVLLRAAGELLCNPGNMTVNDVCGWLTKQGPEAAAIVPRLLAVLDDPSPKSRFAKIEALLAVDQSQTPAALQALEPLLRHELDAVRAQADKVRRTILGPDKA